MLDPITIREIIVSFIGTLIAIFFAGFLWLIKSAYEKHKAEVLALAKFERMFAIDYELLGDNFEFIDKWIAALKIGRPFSFCFRRLITNEEETYKLSNLSLIKKILSINYRLEGTNLDLDNLYKDYWRVIMEINSIPDVQQRENDLKVCNKTILEALKQVKQNRKPLEIFLIDVLANIRVAGRIRFHSLFGYLNNILFKDIFPKMNQNTIKRATECLKREVIEKNENNKSRRVLSKD